MLDPYQPWKPGESAAYPNPSERDDAMLEAMLNHVFASYGAGDFEQGLTANAPYGEVFDILGADASLKAMTPYGVIWPLGTKGLAPGARDAAIQYVKDGGVLVLNAALAKDLPPQLTGVRFEPGICVASQIQTALAALPPIASPYICQRMIPSRNTETLAWTDNGLPMLIWRAVGEGIVITAATESWIDERGALLPLAPALLRIFADAFLPVQQSPDVQMFLNREKDGWIVTLLNNNGVTKTPTQAPSTDPTQAIDCVLNFKKGVPLRFLSYMGEFHWSNRANGLQTRIQPGEAAIVKASFAN
jgi:hypothetical protein